MPPAFIGFVDQDSGDEAGIIVRVVDGVVCLGITLRRDGDIEVCFGASELHTLMRALGDAKAAMERAPGEGR